MAGLYVHIPFCRQKCAYCDFYSMPAKGRSELMEDYVDALLAEWRLRRHETEAPHTLYLGGGTPTSLPLPLLLRLIGELPGETAEELTLELNPDDVTPELLRALADTPVNRVSMGVQSLADGELRAVGRTHSAAGALRAMELLASTGREVSVDLMMGLPGQTPESWERSLRRVLEFRAGHLSAYILSWEPGTRLYAARMAGRLSETPDHVIAGMYATLCRLSREAGYEHYEIANLALPGHRSRHNSAYWRFEPYLGLGPGAHSFDGHTRRYNPPALRPYIEHYAKGMASGEHSFPTVDPENSTERYNDYVMVRLRTSDGLDPQEASLLFGADSAAQIAAAAGRHLASGDMARTASGALRITEEAWLRSDPIIMDFFR